MNVRGGKEVIQVFGLEILLMASGQRLCNLPEPVDKSRKKKNLCVFTTTMKEVDFFFFPPGICSRLLLQEEQILGS